MGCDIHTYIETRVNGVWELVWPSLVKSLRDVECDYEDREEHKLQEYLDTLPPFVRLVDTSTPEGLKEMRTCRDEKWESDLYLGRNYWLFSALAGVRNRDLALTPISPPRGVPKDASVAYTFVVEEEANDVHSHSWFTLAELQAVDWDKGIPFEGFLDAYNYYRLLKGKDPVSWDTYCTEQHNISASEMLEHLKEVRKSLVPYARLEKALREEYSYRCKTKTQWNMSYRSFMEDFLSKFLPALQKLALDSGLSPEDVRFCFHFDN